jgi:hypothetical protein
MKTLYETTAIVACVGATGPHSDRNDVELHSLDERDTVGCLAVTREAAQALAAHLYRKVRITIEVDE